MLRAVIFDMDGVLVDSEPLHVKAERQTLVPFGIELTLEELQSNMGRSTRVFFAELIEKYRLDTTVEQIYPAHKARLLGFYRNEAEPIPGVLPLIQDLLRNGVDAALASSSDREVISAVLEKLDLSASFKTVISGEDVDRTKPYPDIFVETARRLGCDARESVVIEDSSAGVRAAKSAGMICVGFKSPNSGCQDLSAADLIVDDLWVLGAERLRALVNHGS